MKPLRVLFLGGTGVISSACVTEALSKGYDVHVLNRGKTAWRPLPPEVSFHQADIRERTQVEKALKGLTFDVIAQFLAWTPDHVLADVKMFTSRTSQYVFVSSASAYQTPPSHLPVTESTPLRNPFWQYSRNKIACEDALVACYRETGFPVTVVRPSHTYDSTMLPFDGGWTVVDRMRKGKGVVVPGDGTSLWTITHNTDVARGFVGLFGRHEAIGEAFHITGSEAPTWNQIYIDIAHAAGVAEPNLVHVPSDAIAAEDSEWGAAMLGDKSNTMIFDNSKIKSLVPEFDAKIPFVEGARQIIDWYDGHPQAKIVDHRYDALMDRLIDRYSILSSGARK